MDFSHIFSPISVGGRQLKSRLTHTKSGGGLDGTPSQFERSTAYYVAMAKNGAALVCVTVGTWPDCEGKRSVMSNVFMDDPDIQEGFRRLVEAVHQEDTLCMASLMNVEPQELSICELPSWDFDFQGDYAAVRQFADTADQAQVFQRQRIMFPIYTEICAAGLGAQAAVSASAPNERG